VKDGDRSAGTPDYSAGEGVPTAAANYRPAWSDRSLCPQEQSVRIGHGWLGL